MVNKEFYAQQRAKGLEICRNCFKWHTKEEFEAEARIEAEKLEAKRLKKFLKQNQASLLQEKAYVVSPRDEKLLEQAIAREKVFERERIKSRIRTLTLEMKTLKKSAKRPIIAEIKKLRDLLQHKNRGKKRNPENMKKLREACIEKHLKPIWARNEAKALEKARIKKEKEELRLLNIAKIKEKRRLRKIQNSHNAALRKMRGEYILSIEERKKMSESKKLYYQQHPEIKKIFSDRAKWVYTFENSTTQEQKSFVGVNQVMEFFGISKKSYKMTMLDLTSLRSVKNSGWVLLESKRLTDIKKEKKND